MPKRTSDHSSRSFEWRITNSQIILSTFSARKDSQELSVIEAKAVYEEVRQIWESSNAPVPLRSALSRHYYGAWPIQTAIVLGTGPIARHHVTAGPVKEKVAYEFRDWRRNCLTSVIQLALFLGAIDRVCTVSGTSRDQISVYAQDPRFTTLDEELLADLGVKILRIPDTEHLTDHGTFLYAPHVPVPQAMNVLSRCPQHQPAIFIGFGVDIIIDFFANLWKIWCAADKGMIARQSQILLGYKNECMISKISECQTATEGSIHSETYVHVRKRAPAPEAFDQPSNSSCFTIAVGPPRRIRR